jgi:NADPH-dependent ferric siderophore reductase
MSGQDKAEIYIEFVVHGGVLKATAIDAATGTEACIFGPASAPREALRRNAVAKLAYVLKKQKGE